jgi:hypothetical protein
MDKQKLERGKELKINHARTCDCNEKLRQLLKQEQKNKETRKLSKRKTLNAVEKAIKEVHEEFKEENKDKLYGDFKYWWSAWFPDEPEMFKIFITYEKLILLLNLIYIRSDRNQRDRKCPDNDEHWFAVVVMNKEFYRVASKVIKRKQITVKKYIKALCDVGVLKKLGHGGFNRREREYGFGYCYNAGRSPKLMPFLNKKTIKNFLKFKPY